MEATPSRLPRHVTSGPEAENKIAPSLSPPDSPLSDPLQMVVEAAKDPTAVGTGWV